jgi:hypothetical protein
MGLAYPPIVRRQLRATVRSRSGCGVCCVASAVKLDLLREHGAGGFRFITNLSTESGSGVRHVPKSDAQIAEPLTGRRNRYQQQLGRTPNRICWVERIFGARRGPNGHYPQHHRGRCSAGPLRRERETTARYASGAEGGHSPRTYRGSGGAATSAPSPAALASERLTRNVLGKTAPDADIQRVGSGAEQ